MSLRIGTRGSALARVQTGKVSSYLAVMGVAVETVIITTEGDTTTSVPLHEVGNQGIFVRALDDAILRGEIDCAVHSMKDIPAVRPQGVVTCAVLERDSPADFLIHDGAIEDIHIIGTSSTRRRAQLLRHDPSLDVRDLRGNVDTRLRKLKSGMYDGIIIAKAGIDRLNLDVNGTILPTDEFVPAPNQGAVAVVCRDDPALIRLLGALDFPETRADAEIERAVMEELGGGCFTPLGIYSSAGRLTAEVLSADGARMERIEREVHDPDDARECARILGARAAGLIREAQVHTGVEYGR